MSADTIECQQEPPASDWQLAKALYLNGLPTKEITCKANVSLSALWTRMSREKWSKLRAESGSIVTATITTKNAPSEGMSKPQADQLQNASVNVRSIVSGELLQLSNAVVAIKQPKASQGILSRLELLKGIVDVSKTVFGWSDTTTTTAVDIRLLQSAEHRPMVPAIDVPASVAPTPIEPALPAVDVPSTVQGRE